MFNKHDKRTEVEKVIDERIQEFAREAKTPKEVLGVIDLIKGKYEMLATKPHGVKPDTWALIAANILGLVLILNFEKTNILTTKAMNFIVRGRV